MVEKIVVSRDEVMHYPWLDHTRVYVHYTQDDVTKTPRFRTLLQAFLRYGIREVLGNEFENIITDGDYLLIKYDTDEIVDILTRACQWLMENAKVKNPSSEKGQYALENKDRLHAFLVETKEILKNKTYRYFFQRVDGMN